MEVGSVPLICAVVHFGGGDLRWPEDVAWDSDASVLLQTQLVNRASQVMAVDQQAGV